MQPLSLVSGFIQQDPTVSSSIPGWYDGYNFLFRALLKSGPMVATLHRARDGRYKTIHVSAKIVYVNRDAYGDGAGAWVEIAVNRKPTKVLFWREIQTVFGENYNQKVFETENQQNELKVQ